jgi:hypothetical protein
MVANNSISMRLGKKIIEKAKEGPDTIMYCTERHSPLQELKGIILVDCFNYSTKVSTC